MASSPWIVGLNNGHHDAAAALLYEGRLIAMAEEERFSREKRAKDRPPIRALQWCLETAGIGLRDVRAIALGWDYDRLAAWQGCSDAARARRFFHDDPSFLFPAEAFGAAPLPPLVPVPHHLAHAASAYCVSGFHDAALLVCDMRGEDTATTLAHGRDGAVSVLDTFGIGSSLGLFYRAATKYVGLWRSGGEAGKLMGLAAYGEPRHPVPLAIEEGRPVLAGIADTPVPNDGLVHERTEQLLAHFARECFPHEAGLSEDVLAYADFAASAQEALTTAVLGLARVLKEVTGSSRLCLAGGVALNCTTNGALADTGLFDEVFVQPAAHDAGAALGAALVAARAPGGYDRDFTMEHAHWGPGYDEAQICEVLDRRGLPYELLKDEELAAAVAEVLADGGIAGWFQGRAEVGPRALGARSLLASPGTRRNLIRLNRIKGREMWRPIAPSIQAERFLEYFDGTPSPFMIVAAQVRPEVRHLVPAIVHVDGSARPQAVSRSVNPVYWELLEAFARRTGLPLVANTSFNVGGRAIVGSPSHAVDDFLAMDLDALAIGPALVRRS